MKQKTHAVDVLVILVLFVLFTATAVATVLIGIKIYGYSVNSMEDTRAELCHLTFMKK